MASGYTRPKLDVKLRVVELLRKVVTQHEDGTCSYGGGYSDARVVEEVDGKNLTASSVSNIRLQLYGKLRKQVPDEPSAELRAALARVAVLERNLNLVLDAVNNLNTAFSVPVVVLPQED